MYITGHSVLFSYRVVVPSVPLCSCTWEISKELPALTAKFCTWLNPALQIPVRRDRLPLKHLCRQGSIRHTAGSSPWRLETPLEGCGYRAGFGRRACQQDRKRLPLPAQTSLSGPLHPFLGNTCQDFLRIQPGIGQACQGAAIKCCSGRVLLTRDSRLSILPLTQNNRLLRKLVDPNAFYSVWFPAIYFVNTAVWSIGAPQGRVWFGKKCLYFYNSNVSMLSYSFSLRPVAYIVKGEEERDCAPSCFVLFCFALLCLVQFCCLLLWKISVTAFGGGQST